MLIPSFTFFLVFRFSSLRQWTFPVLMNSFPTLILVFHHITAFVLVYCPCLLRRWIFPVLTSLSIAVFILGFVYCLYSRSSQCLSSGLCLVIPFKLMISFGFVVLSPNILLILLTASIEKTNSSYELRTFKAQRFGFTTRPYLLL